jgi:D-alanine transaminase
VTECGSTSFFIVRGDEIVTRPLNNDILPGVTRRAIVELCAARGLKLKQARFTLEEALQADEAFISAASAYVLPVVKIDGHEIGTGKPGESTLRLREIYLQQVRASLI